MNFEDPNPPTGPNHERWMISWADFITLMFAVFVVLFSSVATNKNAAKQVSQAVIDALKSGSISFIMRSRTPGPVSTTKETEEPAAGSRMVQQQAVVELVVSIQVLAEKFQDEIASGKIEMHQEPRGLVISLRQAAFFASGQAALNPDTYPIVDKIGDLIGNVPNRVTLEGHTDPIPIHNRNFESNWQLSAARSIAMLDLLSERNHISRERMSIAGYADTAPIEPNENPEGRAHNRRVDIVILNEFVPAQALGAAH